MSVRGLAGTVIAAAALAAGCNDYVYSPAPAPIESQLNEPFTLAPGQTALLTDVRLKVTFRRLITDGRCPVDVVCADLVQTVAAIEVGVVQSGEMKKIVMVDTGSNPDSKATYNGFEIALEQLEPQRHQGVLIPQTDYRATLLVTPLP